VQGSVRQKNCCPIRCAKICREFQTTAFISVYRQFFSPIRYHRNFAHCPEKPLWKLHETPVTTKMVTTMSTEVKHSAAFAYGRRASSKLLYTPRNLPPPIRFSNLILAGEILWAGLVYWARRVFSSSCKSSLPILLEQRRPTSSNPAIPTARVASDLFPFDAKQNLHDMYLPSTNP